MANIKISELTELTAANVARDDLLVIVDLSEALDADKTKYIQAVSLPGYDGWTADTLTWTYASTNTFTVPGDYEDTFTVGTKLKMTNSTTKYFYVQDSTYSSTNTVVTVVANDNYALSTDAISNNFYSYQSTPQGFPHFFDYTPTWTAATANPAIGSGDLIGMFTISERMVHYTVAISAASDTTFGIGAWEVGLPVDAGAYSDSLFRWLGRGWARDNSGDDNYDVMPTVARFASGIGSGRMIVPGTGAESLNASTPFTWDEDDSLVLSGCYPI